MKNSVRAGLRFVLLMAIMLTLFSFAMFQGGFVSWFLFYSILPIFTYYICLLLYPLKKWEVSGELSSNIINASDQVTLTIKIKRKFPFPIHYCICEQVIPQNMHQVDIGKEKFAAIHDPSRILHHREAKKVIFPWFRRTVRLSFEFQHMPRGEYNFNEFKIRTSDLFGFVQKESSFQLHNKMIVFPAVRTTHITQQLSSFDSGSVSSYAFQLKNTNVAVGVREYISGDKFSWIDWKQTARQQEIMTKEFEQEKSTEMMVLFDGTSHANINPVAFEGAIEVTLSLFGELIKQSSQINLLSLGHETVQFSAHAFLHDREKVWRHFARINPDSERPLSFTLKEELMNMDQSFNTVFVTTMLNEEIKLSVDRLRVQSKKVVVLYIQSKQLMTEQEQANMRLLQTKGVQICFLTDRHLKVDPIEVKF